jgi:hypothetical protein
MSDDVRRIADGGRTILIVEQNAYAALSVADHGYVLENGRVALGGHADDPIENDYVRQIYLGAWRHAGLGSDARSRSSDPKQLRLQFRVRLKHAAWTRVHDLTVDHDVGPVGEIEHEVDLVLDQQNAGPLAELLDGRQDLCHNRRSQTLEWFIKQDQSLRGAQGATDREHLPFATAQVFSASILARPQFRKQLVDVLERPTALALSEGEVLHDGQVWKDTVAIIQITGTIQMSAAKPMPRQPEAILTTLRRHDETATQLFRGAQCQIAIVPLPGDVVRSDRARIEDQTDSFQVAFCAAIVTVVA